MTFIRLGVRSGARRGFLFFGSVLSCVIVKLVGSRDVKALSQKLKVKYAVGVESA